MSNDPDFERRINNQLATIVENQARFSEDMDKVKAALVDLIQVVRHHDEEVDGLREQIKETSESVKQTTDNLNALIRIVEGHVSNHP